MRRLRHLIRSFDACLPSAVCGIDFTALIQGRLLSIDLDDIDIEQLAYAIKAELRTIAGRISKRCDPEDLQYAADRCNQDLSREITIPAYPHVSVSGRVKLQLTGAGTTALREFKTALLKQASEDAVRLQHADAVRRLFTDPSMLLAWWISSAPGVFEKPPKIEQLENLLDTFNAYPRIAEIPLESQLLDLLRRFVAEFSKEHQRRAIMALIGSGFQAMGKDELAAELISLTIAEAP